MSNQANIYNLSMTEILHKYVEGKLKKMPNTSHFGQPLFFYIYILVIVFFLTLDAGEKTARLKHSKWKLLSWLNNPGLGWWKEQIRDQEEIYWCPWGTDLPNASNITKHFHHSPSCRCKPVRLSFIFETQMKIFYWNLIKNVLSLHWQATQLPLWRFKMLIKRS